METQRMTTLPGNKIRAGTSGFGSYTTSERDADTLFESTVLHPEHLLEKIRELQSVLSITDIEEAISLIRRHITDYNNPHHTDLPQFDTDIGEYLYQKYKAAGGTGSYEFFLHCLFSVLYVADLETIKKGTDPNALISVAGARWFLRDHNSDPNAHDELFRRMFPGTAVMTDPVYSINAMTGLSPMYQPNPMNDTDDYAYIGNDGRLHVSTKGYIPIEYIDNEPMIPCWETRTNLWGISTSFAAAETFNTTITVDDSVISPLLTKDASKVVLSTETFKTPHKIILPEIRVDTGQSIAYSLFVKSGSCKYVTIQFKDTVTGPTIKGVFDIVNGSVITINSMGRAQATLYPLADGWFRCCFTWTALIEQHDRVEILFFKDKTDNESFMGDGSTAAYIWGIQVEYGSGASPYIPTNGSPKTRKAIPIRANLSMINATDDRTITVVCQTPCRGEKDKPLYTLCDATLFPSEKAIFTKEPMFRLTSQRPIAGIDPIETTFDFASPVNGPNQLTVLSHSSDNEKTITMISPDKISTSIANPAWYRDAKWLYLGYSPDTKNYLNGYIRSLAIYPRSFTENHLIFLNGELGND